MLKSSIIPIKARATLMSSTFYGNNKHQRNIILSSSTNHKSVSSGIYFRVCKRKFKKQTCLQTTSLMSTPENLLPDLPVPSSIPLASNVATSNANQRENKHSGFLPFLRPTRNYHFDEYFMFRKQCLCKHILAQFFI